MYKRQILTFDIFKTYIKPSATPKQLIFVAHVCICIWGVVMAVFAIIWNVIGIDLGWLFLVMGLLIGGAVFPGQFSLICLCCPKLISLQQSPSP